MAQIKVAVTPTSRADSDKMSKALQRFRPDIAEAMLKRGWEFMSHGLYNTRYHWGMGEDEVQAGLGTIPAIVRETGALEVTRAFNGRSLAQPPW